MSAEFPDTQLSKLIPAEGESHPTTKEVLLQNANLTAEKKREVQAHKWSAAEIHFPQQWQRNFLACVTNIKEGNHENINTSLREIENLIDELIDILRPQYMLNSKLNLPYHAQVKDPLRHVHECKSTLDQLVSVSLQRFKNINLKSILAQYLAIVPHDACHGIALEVNELMSESFIEVIKLILVKNSNNDEELNQFVNEIFDDAKHAVMTTCPVFTKKKAQVTCNSVTTDIEGVWVQTSTPTDRLVESIGTTSAPTDVEHLKKEKTIKAMVNLWDIGRCLKLKFKYNPQVSFNNLDFLHESIMCACEGFSDEAKELNKIFYQVVNNPKDDPTPEQKMHLSGFLTQWFLGQIFFISGVYESLNIRINELDQNYLFGRRVVDEESDLTLVDLIFPEFDLQKSHDMMYILAEKCRYPDYAFELFKTLVHYKESRSAAQFHKIMSDLTIDVRQAYVNNIVALKPTEQPAPAR